MSDRSSWRFAEISDEMAPAKADDNDDTDMMSERLWTRRNAVALTAGFFALGATGQASAFTQKRRVVADHVVISKKNRVMELMRRRQDVQTLPREPRLHARRSQDPLR